MKDVTYLYVMVVALYLIGCGAPSEPEVVAPSNMGLPICIQDVLFQNETAGGTLRLEDPPPGQDSATVANMLPCIVFTGLEFGPYSFIYEVCSVARPDICKSDTAYFYHMDIGTIVPIDTFEVCEEDTVEIVFDSLFTTYIVGADVELDTNYMIGDTVCCPGQITVTRTPVNPDPLVYVLDPACVPETFEVNLKCVCCTIDTIDCGTGYVIDGLDFVFDLDGVTNQVDWTGPGGFTATIIPPDSLTINDPDPGTYYATSLVGQCTTTYQIEVIEAAAPCVVTITPTLLAPTSCSQITGLQAASTSTGTYEWSTGATTAYTAAGVGTYTVTLTTVDAVCTETVTVPPCSSNTLTGSAYIDVDNDGLQGPDDLLTVKEFFLMDGATVVTSQTASTYNFTGLGCDTRSIRIDDAVFDCPSAVQFVFYTGDGFTQTTFTGITTFSNVGSDDAIDFDFPFLQFGVHSKTGSFTSCGQTLDFDAGYRVNTSIRGIVFGDNNGDNVYDVGDTFINLASVLLFDDGGTNIASTVTGVDGKYAFVNIQPGFYHVRFDSTPPLGYTGFVTANVGADDGLDSDVIDAAGNTAQVRRYVCDDDISVSVGYKL